MTTLTPKVTESLPLKSVSIESPLWSAYARLVREVVIPYQWDALNDRVPDAPKSHAIENFRIAAGEAEGEFHGALWQDSDAAKWLEAVGHSLQTHADPKLEQLADETIELIAKAQSEDGYLGTYVTLTAPEKRWTNLHEMHELYCAGHMMEAGVAYFQATGKKKLLQVVCGLADHIAKVFGKGPGQIPGYPGHQEVELALVKLYRATGKKKYLETAKFFIDERGTEPNYFDVEWEKRGRYSDFQKKVIERVDKVNNQSHIPVREQTVAGGHAVRAVYMYAGMVDVASETGDDELMQVCRRLWKNVAWKQLYITGGVGSSHRGEAFTFDYDLPNEMAYAETCAAVGLIFFAHRMLKVDLDREYADVIERALYNSLLAAMAKDGRQFFYVNPLEVWPEACEKNPEKKHIAPIRCKWFGCACCPPNVARLLASLGEYVYTSDDQGVYVHLYIGGEVGFEIGGNKVQLTQKTDFPWHGKVSFQLETSQNDTFTLGLRIPGWCRGATVSINGGAPEVVADTKKGYLMLQRAWVSGDEISLELEMPIERMRANPMVRADAGRVAIQRGPLVYCIEECDNGANLSALSLSSDEELKAEFDGGLMGGITVVKGTAHRVDEERWGNELYKSDTHFKNSVELTAVPYFCWGNRRPGEMMVWIRSE